MYPRKDMEGSGRGLTQGIIYLHCQERLSKTTKNLNQDIRSPDRYLDPGRSRTHGRDIQFKIAKQQRTFYMKTSMRFWDGSNFEENPQVFSVTWWIPSHYKALDITGTIRRSQMSNSGQSSRIVTLCVCLLTCYLLAKDYNRQYVESNIKEWKQLTNYMKMEHGTETFLHNACDIYYNCVTIV
jgi:hypothetical protein